MSNQTYQQRGNQNSRMPVSQRRMEGGRALEDNRAAFTAKQLKQGETAQRVEEEDALLKEKTGTTQRVKNDEEKTAQAKFSGQAPLVQREEQPARPNNTGLPDNLKNGIESLSGLSMDNVKVHYNSVKPRQLNALAYAQGTDIHVGPGQEKHLPHEAWHVVQQAQGRVRPTMQMKDEDGVAVNDDARLERESDVMGRRAASVGRGERRSIKSAPIDSIVSLSNGPIQRAQADVNYRIDGGGVQNVQGEAVGQGAVGGQTHSEQRVWEGIEDVLTTALGQGRNVNVTFSVDTTICHLCSPWFENTVWVALNNANNGGTFHLFVEVGGAQVEVVGNNTIWPNEIADAPTWNRLGEFERMDRFLTDNRDKDGERQEGELSNHVASLFNDLKEQMAIGQITEADVEQCLAMAKTDACRVQVAAYNFRTHQGAEDPNAMEATMNEIDLFEVMSSGRLGATPDFSYDGGLEIGQNNWRQTLTYYFQGWLENWIDENLEERRIQGEY